jgi:hypothetical protein
MGGYREGEGKATNRRFTKFETECGIALGDFNSLTFAKRFNMSRWGQAAIRCRPRLAVALP